MKTNQEIFDKAKGNREDFLKPYHEKFKTAQTRKKKFEIIAELIAIEPSHLREPWIIREVENWLRDYRECESYIVDVFVKAPKKRARTDKKTADAVWGFYLIRDVEKYTREGYSIPKAISKILINLPSEANRYLKWDLDKTADLDLADLIRKFYEKSKKQCGGGPQWPYFGRDVDIENGKIVISGGR